MKKLILFFSVFFSAAFAQAQNFGAIEYFCGAASGQLRNTTLTGNTCFDLQATKTQTYGIVVTASAGKSDILTIVGNNVGRNLTGGINDGSDGANETITANQLTP